MLVPYQVDRNLHEPCFPTASAAETTTRQEFPEEAFLGDGLRCIRIAERSKDESKDASAVKLDNRIEFGCVFRDGRITSDREAGCDSVFATWAGRPAFGAGLERTTRSTTAAWALSFDLFVLGHLIRGKDGVERSVGFGTKFNLLGGKRANLRGLGVDAGGIVLLDGGLQDCAGGLHAGQNRREGGLLIGEDGGGLCLLRCGESQ
jgi:hypothetical protein